MITKWRLMTKAFIKDGDLGRAADLWGKEEVVLDVFSTGTVVTSWQEQERIVEDRDGDNRVVGVSHSMGLLSSSSYNISPLISCFCCNEINY